MCIGIVAIQRLVYSYGRHAGKDEEWIIVKGITYLFDMGERRHGYHEELW